ncbi:MAG: type IV pilus biogenesis/stability protein PilW [Cycloclasticus sp.]|nr:type IV pilus biogenesis/stability protein PilW [Cycloclasticus sp.]
MEKKVFRLILVCLTLLLCACQGQQIKEETQALKGTEKSPADVYVSLGVEYMKRGMYDVALEKLNLALRTDPSSSNAHNVIAVLYDQLGEKQLAGRHYEKAVALTPSNSSANNNYARYLCAQDEFLLAEKHFTKALENPLYRSRLMALTNAGTCAWRAGDMDKAENYYRTALQRNKQYPSALLQMAKLKYERKNYLAARGYLKRLKAIKQNSSAFLWLGIQVEDKLNNQNAVSSYILELRQLFPDSHEMTLLEKSKFNR